MNIYQKIEIDKQSILKLSCNDTMILFNVTVDKFPKKEYELLLTLDQLIKKSKFFNNFENTNELINWLTNSIKEKNSNIKINEKDCIIQILNPISSKMIDLSINLKKEDLNSRVAELEEIIIQQNKEILFLKEKINKFESIFEEFNQQKEKIKQFETIIDEYTKEKKKDLLLDSDILNETDKKLLLKWLPSIPIQTTLLLNSKNFKNDKSFNQIINNTLLDKSHTLVVIQTKDGFKFGGYSTQKWEKDKRIYDSNAFVFSLDKGKKYNIIKPENSYYLCGSWWGFGADENTIVLVDNCFSSDNYVCNKTYDIKEKFELNGGKRNFSVKSLEIFHVKY